MFPKAALISLIFFILCCRSIDSSDCEPNAILTIFQNSNESSETVRSTWEIGANLSSYGCDIDGNFAILAHGYGDFALWVPDMVQKFLQYRGGCVIYLNYSKCIDMSNYIVTLTRWQSVSALVTKKLNDMEDEGIDPNNILLYGFSIGARIVIDGAINFGPQKVGLIDACDPAAEGFDYIYNKDPKTAAKNVQCIKTSNYAGSAIRNCHQNWLMGNCGNSQDGANDLGFFWCALTNCKTNVPLGSHTICNPMYSAAFENRFVANNVKHCSGVTTSNVPADFRMGYNEMRKNITGIFAAPTYRNYPWNS